MSFNPTGPAGGPVPGPGPGPVPGALPAGMPGPMQGQPPMPGPGQPFPQQQQQRSASGPAAGGAPVALIGAAAMLLAEAILLLLTLVEAPNHLSYLTNLLGISSNWFPAPFEFSPGDVATVAVLVAGVIGCQGGRSWGRPAIMATMALTLYPAATSLLSELMSNDTRSAFAQGHNLWFNLILILELLIAAGTLVAGFATASRGGASVPVPGRPPMPGPGQPFPQQPPQGQPFPQQPPQGQPFPQQPPAPGYAPPPAQPGYPAPSPVPPPVSYQPPSPDIRIGQQPGPGYAQPPVPPQGGPAQQGRTPGNPPGA